MPKTYGRNERVASAIMRECADILQHELKDPRLVQATVTEVRVTPDLRNARIFVSFMTDDQEIIKAAMDGLKHACGFVRTQLAARLKLRYMPQIQFVFDELLTKSMELDALIARGLKRD